MDDDIPVTAVQIEDDEPLLQGLLALSRGELDHRIPRTGRRDSQDAMAFLFNAMADQIQDLVTSLDTKRSTLQAGVEELSDVLTRMAAADFEARIDRSYDASPLDVLGFLVNATAEELGALYQELRETNERLERQAHATVNERLAATNTLAAGVGHELRNPLGVAAGNLEHLAETLPALLGERYDEQVAQAIEDSRIAVDRAAGIAKELGLLRPSPKPRQRFVDLKPVVATSMRLVQNIVSHRARLEVVYEPGAKTFADEARVGQAVVNLVHNAVLAMPPHRSVADNEITVWSGPISEEEVMIEIRDNGVGMSAEVRERVFEAFFTTRPVGEGTGLGLAISQRLIHDQGGRIELTSEEGVGTTVRIILPLAVHPESTSRTTGREVPLPDLLAAVAPLKVLLIDDESLFGIVVRNMLSPETDFTVTTSAVEGLELLRSGDYDAVLSDLMMPEIDGREIYETLRAEGHPATAHFAFITGGSFSAEAQAFLDSVEAPVLGKPFSRREILTTVAQVARR